jgi:hypothetical protein
LNGTDPLLFLRKGQVARLEQFMVAWYWRVGPIGRVQKAIGQR